MVFTLLSSTKARVSPVLDCPTERSSRHARRLTFYASIALVLGGTSVIAQQSHIKPRRSQPATTARASPETTATIANAPTRNAPGKTGPSASLATRLSSLPDPAAPDVDPLPVPFELPPASRARMRTCGERWNRMKLDGEAQDEIWRDFATTCLVAKVGAGDEQQTGHSVKTGLEPNKLH